MLVFRCRTVEIVTKMMNKYRSKLHLKTNHEKKIESAPLDIFVPKLIASLIKIQKLLNS